MQATLDPKQLQRFRDPVWRISNLYAIRTREGKVVPFRPRPQQLQVLQMIYRGSVFGAPNCIGFEVCFSRTSALTRSKLRLPSAKPSESHGSKGQFRYRSAPKAPSQNTVGKRQELPERADCGYPCFRPSESQRELLDTKFNLN
jgi:hypothetical protein